MTTYVKPYLADISWDLEIDRAFSCAKSGPMANMAIDRLGTVFWFCPYGYDFYSLIPLFMERERVYFPEPLRCI